MKAVALFSGGLDSILALKIISNQGIEVSALYFRVPFSQTNAKALNQLNGKLKSMAKDHQENFLATV